MECKGDCFSCELQERSAKATCAAFMAVRQNAKIIEQNEKLLEQYLQQEHQTMFPEPIINID